MPTDFYVGGWLIQPALNRATKDGRTVHVRPKVMDVLVVLSAHPRVVLSKDDILKGAWGAEFVSDSALTSVVADLRRLFDDDVERPRLIETIPKRGYRLIAEVRPAGAAGESTSLTPIAPVGHDAATAASDRLSERSFRVQRIVPFALLVATTVAVAWLSTTVAWNGTPRPRAPIRDIAVLPFQDFSGTKEGDLLAHAITDGLISELTRLDGFQRVVAHESAMRYATPRRSLKDITNDLQVQAFITGTVARTDNEIRIRVELVDARTERQLWSDMFVRNGSVLIDVQRQVVRDIVREARITITPRQRQRLEATGRRTNPEAYQSVVSARAESARINYVSAVHHYDQALAVDPDMADAWAELALTLVHRAYGNPAHMVIPRARAAADRALELDPDNAVARIALGRIRLHVDWDWDGAGRELRSAVALDPHSPDARWQYAFYLGVIGRMDESVREAREAVRLDPLSPLTHYALAFQLRVARQYQNAIEAFTRAIALAPNRPVFVAQRALTHALNGDCARADADLAASGRTAFAAFVAAKCGASGEARATAIGLRQAGRCPADIYAALGDNDAAFACLEEHYAQREFSLVQLATGVVFIDLQRDHRFEELLRRMAYPR